MVTTLVNANVTETPRIDLTKGGLIQGSQKGMVMADAQMAQLKAIQTVDSCVVENDATVEVIRVKVNRNDWQIRLSQLLGQKANMEAQFNMQMSNLNDQITQIQSKLALFDAVEPVKG